jgi:hypothetical protein
VCECVRVGACLGQNWLSQGAGSSEIMLLVTGCPRLVTVRSGQQGGWLLSDAGRAICTRKITALCALYAPR